jgi:hypothetical protein
MHPTAWKYGFSEIRQPLDFVTHLVTLGRREYTRVVNVADGTTKQDRKDRDKKYAHKDL